MFQKITTLLKEKSFDVPYLLFMNYSKINITDEELILLIYIINSDFLFDCARIANDLSKDSKAILKLINSLVDKDLMSLDIRKKGSVREEFFNLDNLYKKLSFLVINKDEEENKNTIYDQFEKEFGRTLSPMEYEIINGWQKEHSEELIFLALKEAVYNGVFNLRWIDKVLYEWNKKGYKNKSDIENAKANFRKSKEKVKEVFDYDWLNDHNE